MELRVWLVHLHLYRRICDWLWRKDFVIRVFCHVGSLRRHRARDVLAGHRHHSTELMDCDIWLDFRNDQAVLLRAAHQWVFKRLAGATINRLLAFDLLHLSRLLLHSFV